MLKKYRKPKIHNTNVNENNHQHHKVSPEPNNANNVDSVDRDGEYGIVKKNLNSKPSLLSKQLFNITTEPLKDSSSNSAKKFSRSKSLTNLTIIDKNQITNQDDDTKSLTNDYYSENDILSESSRSSDDGEEEKQKKEILENNNHEIKKRSRKRKMYDDYVVNNLTKKDITTIPKPNKQLKISQSNNNNIEKHRKKRKRKNKSSIFTRIKRHQTSLTLDKNSSDVSNISKTIETKNKVTESKKAITIKTKSENFVNNIKHSMKKTNTFTYRGQNGKLIKLKKLKIVLERLTLDEIMKRGNVITNNINVESNITINTTTATRLVKPENLKNNKKANVNDKQKNVKNEREQQEKKNNDLLPYKGNFFCFFILKF